MGDRLGIPGAVDFFFFFFIIYIIIIIIKLFFIFIFFSLIVFCFYYFYMNEHEFLYSEQKIGFLNAESSFGGH